MELLSTNAGQVFDHERIYDAVWGLEFVTVPVLSILEAAVLSIAACLAVTCFPLEKIAKMNIVDSIEAVE
ncbi:hypothetical protein [Caproicibacter fermentans]|uniref:hypothetical protein n=1 Tax=Caproicibacter fermentans TaxID=2576756 RepID=UPI0038B25729